MIPCLTGPTAATEPGGGPPVLRRCYHQGACFRFAPAGQDVPARGSVHGLPPGAWSAARRGTAARESSVFVRRRSSPAPPVMAGMGVPRAPGHGCRPGGPPEMTLYDLGCPGSRESLFGYAATSRDNSGIACT